ncbi:hypothetical protein CEXT_531291 [Caerostris extrusa]|uniref:Secreted protein n=1 Tax=Caerostris extrusa TaxID=172846 RepID=A0AAV4TH30_CAEEX|nr:hypothetical protein CEXT_531291 [Caerostris extrusa]
MYVIGSFVYLTYLRGCAIHQVASSALLSFLGDNCSPLPFPHLGSFAESLQSGKLKLGAFMLRSWEARNTLGTFIVLLHRFPYGQRSTNGLVLLLCWRVFPT